MYRHRLFEFGGGLTAPEPPKPPEDIRPLALAAYALLGCSEPPRWQDKPDGGCGWPHPIAAPKAAHWEPGCFASPSGNEFKGPSERSFGIDWMHERADRGEAIPPAMAEWIARQVAAQLDQVGRIRAGEPEEQSREAAPAGLSKFDAIRAEMGKRPVDQHRLDEYLRRQREAAP